MDAAKAAPASWDLCGIVGTGQSLSVGNEPIHSTRQLHGHLKLSLGAARVPPFDPTSSELSLVPLTEPIRPLTSGYPRPYPDNIYGETHHSAMAHEVSALCQKAGLTLPVTIHTVVGESGQGMIALRKDPVETADTGRAYAATLFEVEAITRLAKAAGKTYGVTAVVIVHGETDAGNNRYAEELVQLWSDYNRDLKSITGQVSDISMLVSQQNSCPTAPNQRSGSTLAQWRAGVEGPGFIVCSGPKYHLPGDGDGIHLSALGHQMLGEKLGQIYFQRVVLGDVWRPLGPNGVERRGKVITVDFQVPNGPLRWDDRLPSARGWPNGRGFEVRAGDRPLAIDSVAIAGCSVRITCAEELGANNLSVGYAMTSEADPWGENGTHRWGQLCDSDPFVGSTTGRAQPNYAVAFELEVP